MLETRVLPAWTPVAGMPIPRSEFAATLGADGRIYAIGGADANGTPLPTVEAYTPATNTWSTVASLFVPRKGLAAVEGTDGRIYAIGGMSPSGLTRVVEAYTPAANTWTQVAALPTPRSGLGAAVGSDGRIYAVGGADASGAPLATVEAYTPTTNRWATVASLSMPRSGLAVAEGSDGRIYAIGGKATFVTNFVEAYVPAANRWSPVAPMPTPRSELAAAAGADGRIYAIGGADANGTPLAVVEAYTPDTGVRAIGGDQPGLIAIGNGANIWTPADALPTARSKLAAAADIAGHIFALGGTGFAGTLNRVEALAVSNKRSTSTAVASSANPSLAGEGVILSATVNITPSGAITPTGTIQFVIDGRNAGSGVRVIITNGVTTATFSTSGLTVGTHTVTAIFSGDSSFSSSTGTLSGGQVVRMSSAANSAFVAQVYLDLLNRPADPSGLATFANALNQGMTPNQVVLAIEGSTEYRTNLVESFYSQFLGRAADATGLIGALQVLGTGGTNEQLLSAIAGSPEYFQKSGATNEGFLNALYEDALGRPIDPSGEAEFTQALAAGMSRVQVAAAIFSSTEYQQNLVESYYQRFLRRPSDPQAVAWVKSLQSGSTDAQVLAGIVGSEEYLQRARL